MQGQPTSASRVHATRRSGLLSRHARETLRAALIHTVLIAGSVLILLPLAWMLSTSLKDPGDIFVYPPIWIPQPIVWENYVEAMTAQPFALFFRNTALITFTTLIGQVFSSSLVGFSFARLRWIGRDAFFVIVLATMMLPPQVTLIPQFVLYRYIGWVDTFYPLIIPSFFAAGSAFYIFLMRQFYLTIPLEMDDAAKIDGCSTFGIYWRIVAPLTKPALIAISIFSFHHHWNEFLGPLIYLHSKENYTLALALRFFQGTMGTDWHLLMAASLIVMLPVIIVFFVAQRYFIQGVVFTGVKG